MGENEKKQVPLRLSSKLYNAIASWAEDDFRSVNGQIEYLLTECVRQRKKNGKYVSDEIDKPLDIDILHNTHKRNCDAYSDARTRNPNKQRAVDQRHNRADLLCKDG